MQSLILSMTMNVLLCWHFFLISTIPSRARDFCFAMHDLIFHRIDAIGNFKLDTFDVPSVRFSIRFVYFFPIWFRCIWRLIFWYLLYISIGLGYYVCALRKEQFSHEMQFYWRPTWDLAEAEMVSYNSMRRILGMRFVLTQIVKYIKCSIW